MNSGDDVSPSVMSEIVDYINQNNVKYIFFDSSTTSKSAETISKETGVELLILSPFESLTQEQIDNGEDYFSIMRTNLENLKTALS